MKIAYNSPVILNFTLVSLLISLINFTTRTNGLNGLLDPFTSLHGHFQFNHIAYYTGFILYPFNHADSTHLIGNLSFILLLGPILEEKYGSSQIAQAIVLTTLTTALLNSLLFSSGLIGASGIVFTFIILVSITNTKSKGIPLTFLIVFALFIGKEIYMGLFDDQISQFAHIMGGIVGGIIGLSRNRKIINEG